MFGIHLCVCIIGHNDVRNQCLIKKESREIKSVNRHSMTSYGAVSLAILFRVLYKL